MRKTGKRKGICASFRLFHRHVAHVPLRGTHYSPHMILRVLWAGSFCRSSFLEEYARVGRVGPTWCVGTLWLGLVISVAYIRGEILFKLVLNRKAMFRAGENGRTASSSPQPIAVSETIRAECSSTSGTVETSGQVARADDDQPLFNPPTKKLSGYRIPVKGPEDDEEEGAKREWKTSERRPGPASRSRGVAASSTKDDGQPKKVSKGDRKRK